MDLNWRIECDVDICCSKLVKKVSLLVLLFCLNPLLKKYFSDTHLNFDWKPKNERIFHDQLSYGLFFTTSTRCIGWSESRTDLFTLVRITPKSRLYYRTESLFVQLTFFFVFNFFSIPNKVLKYLMIHKRCRVHMPSVRLVSLHISVPSICVQPVICLAIHVIFQNFVPCLIYATTLQLWTL